MLIRKQAANLRPGAYLIGVGPEAAQMDYTQLHHALDQALRRLQDR
jgi:hypothetical protein